MMSFRTEGSSPEMSFATSGLLPIAVHEAAHAVVAYLCRAPITEIWIAPTTRGGWVGTPDPRSKDEKERKILILVAGLIAEERCRPPGSWMYISEDDVDTAKSLCEELYGSEGAGAEFRRARTVVESWFSTPQVSTAIEKLASALNARLGGEPLRAEMSGQDATAFIMEMIPDQLRRSASTATSE
jgi:hypothetical protein